MKNFDEIDELFGNAFGDFEVTPPVDVKAAIDNRISFGKKPKGYWYFGLSLLTLIGFLAVNIAAKVELKDLNSTENLQAKFSEKSIEKTTSRDEVIRHGQQAYRAEKGTEKSPVDRSGFEKETAQKADGIDRKVTINKQSPESKRYVSKNDESINIDPKRKKDSSEKKFDKGNRNENSQNQSETNDGEKKTNLANQSSSEKEDSNSTDKENATKNTEESKANDVAKNTEDGGKAPEPTESLNDENVSGNEEPDNGLPIAQTKATMGNWIQLTAGPGFGLNGISENNTGFGVESRKPIIDASLEYNFGFNERLGLSTGIGFNQFDDAVTQKYYVADSTFAEMVIDTVWNPNTQQFDSITVASYNYFNTEQVTGNMFRFTSIEIPVFATWMMNKESKFDLSVSAGVKLSYNSFKTLDGDQLKDMVSLNTFGVKLMVRPQFVYHLGKFGLGAYVRYSSEILPVVEYSGTKRLLQDFGAGILFRYSF